MSKIKKTIIVMSRRGLFAGSKFVKGCWGSRMIWKNTFRWTINNQDILLCCFCLSLLGVMVHRALFTSNADASFAENAKFEHDWYFVEKWEVEYDRRPDILDGYDEYRYALHTFFES